ncbi:DUF4920 domain-containing protein [Flavobacterium gelatinilyticum]|uniref:DUF4920 domain-containing protein n=1 Tax=Flavobacterium gelatinilyticum TaxID=3003260 RepID=UPI002480E995|nr:DUF4920 domain-containing protein [Flavobacterium gelatinilyticum]
MKKDLINKKSILCSVVLFICFNAFCFSQEDVEKPAPPAGNALVGDYYGEDVSAAVVNKAISAEELEKELNGSAKVENAVVQGKVTDVCGKRGCWLTIKTTEGSSFFVKMKDYAFFVPTAVKGKNVVLTGNAEKKVTSVKELKHYAKEAKKTKTEINEINKPKEEIQFLASGIKVVN